MYLDEALVFQQLRYTGMLETVRIRRSGYGAKYTFQVQFFLKLLNHKSLNISNLYCCCLSPSGVHRAF